MDCMICTSGASSGFFASILNTPLSLTIFGVVLAALVVAALFVCYRVGIAYTRQAQAEVDAMEAQARKHGAEAAVRQKAWESVASRRDIR